MLYLNNCTASSLLDVEPWHISTPTEEYDLNFIWPIPDPLSTPGGVLLVPLIPARDAHALLAGLNSDPTLLQYTCLPGTPALDTLEGLCTVLEGLRRDPGALLFAVFDQSLALGGPPAEGEAEETRAERLAGMAGITHASEQNRSAEIGSFIVLPAFQRSHVTTHAASLILIHLLDTLQLRRVGWGANLANLASQRVAARLGFREEGRLRWTRVAVEGKVANSLDGWEEEERKHGRGVDSWVGSVTWEDWRDGGRERVAGLLAREVKKRTVAGLSQ